MSKHVVGQLRAVMLRYSIDPRPTSLDEEEKGYSTVSPGRRGPLLTQLLVVAHLQRSECLLRQLPLLEVFIHARGWSARDPGPGGCSGCGG